MCTNLIHPHFQRSLTRTRNGKGIWGRKQAKNEIDLKPRGSIFNLADACVRVSVCVFGTLCFCHRRFGGGSIDWLLLRVSPLHKARCRTSISDYFLEHSIENKDSGCSAALPESTSHAAYHTQRNTSKWESEMKANERKRVTALACCLSRADDNMMVILMCSVLS